jgi:hypothetical protein
MAYIYLDEIENNPRCQSEFGFFVGGLHGGSIVVSEGNLANHADGTLVFISSAFNTLTSADLREIADEMDSIRLRLRRSRRRGN